MPVLADHDNPRFTNANSCLSGFRLALACHDRRGPFNSTSDYPFFAVSLRSSLFTSQVFMNLNLNGSFYSFESIRRRVLI
jgi:hypothetical protein